MKIMRSLVLFGLVSMMGASGCGDDDGNKEDMSGGDLAGADLTVTGDMVTAGATFESYVIGLIDTHTNAKDLPDDVVTKSAGLTDTQLQSDFAKYFP